MLAWRRLLNINAQTTKICELHSFQPSSHYLNAKLLKRSFLINEPTDSTQERGDGVPDSDAAHAQPLSDGQLQVEQGKALEYQGYQVGDEESTWRKGRGIRLVGSYNMFRWCMYRLIQIYINLHCRQWFGSILITMYWSFRCERFTKKNICFRRTSWLCIRWSLNPIQPILILNPSSFIGHT